VQQGYEGSEGGADDGYQASADRGTWEPEEPWQGATEASGQEASTEGPGEYAGREWGTDTGEPEGAAWEEGPVPVDSPSQEGAGGQARPTLVEDRGQGGKDRPP
jgi:hypothetical protein